MRENKYKFLVRVGDESVITESYFLGDLVDTGYGIDILCEYSADEILEQLQYTGLKDKNGVEIYEGDICRLTSSDGQDSIAYVSYELNCFVFKNYVMTDYTLHNNFMSKFKKEIEVIGNIYENNELLNKS